MAGRKALIVGLAGLELAAGEAAFLRSARPAGLILFARNVATPAQVRALVEAAKAEIGAGDDTLVLIDQEGGRVRRLRPPHWRELPPARAYATLAASDRRVAGEAARAVARLTASDLRDIGINVSCAPVLDVPVPGAHDIIGDRAYGARPEDVVALARPVAEGLAEGGVVPVIKHIPGHGRAMADSHLELPVVTAARSELEATDFAPFRALADQPAAMTAHVVFTAIDPALPASTSPIVTREVIRGHIGFEGLLMSDDLGMRALSGGMRERAEAVIAAGSDLAIHCSGNLAEMVDAADGVPWVAGPAEARLARCLAVVNSDPQPVDVPAAEAALARVLAIAAGSHAAAGESV